MRSRPSPSSSPGCRPSASVERGRIDIVFWVATAICIAIFAIVFAVTIFSVMKFRARPDDDSDGPPIHGHTGLEIAWTAVPTVLVVVIGVVSAVALAKNDRIPSDHMTVEVTAQQFAWTFKYPGGGDVTTTELRLPLNKSTELNLRALDVIHSFWVPQFGQKQDAVPGITTHLKITPNKLGKFPVICTELCGLGHATMRSWAVVMKPDAFKKWLAEAKKGISGPGAGLAVFNNNGCGSCHTFAPAKAKGDRRARPRRSRGRGEEGGRPAPAVRPRVDRRPEQVPRAWLPSQRHAEDVRDPPQVAARRPRRLPGERR